MRGTEKIDLHFDLPEPPAEVWRALTEPKLLEAWLMPNDIKPEVGHKFMFRSQPRGDWDGLAYCVVTEVVPEQRLQYEWRGKQDHASGEYKFDTLLTFTLTRKADGGTHLHLLHEGFDPSDFALKVMGEGWKSMASTRISAALRAKQQAAAK